MTFLKTFPLANSSGRRPRRRLRQNKRLFFFLAVNYIVGHVSLNFRIVSSVTPYHPYTDKGDRNVPNLAIKMSVGDVPSDGSNYWGSIYLVTLTSDK